MEGFQVPNFKFQIPNFKVILIGVWDLVIVYWYFKYWGAKLIDSGLFEKEGLIVYEENLLNNPSLRGRYPVHAAIPRI